MEPTLKDLLSWLNQQKQFYKEGPIFLSDFQIELARKYLDYRKTIFSGGMQSGRTTVLKLLKKYFKERFPYTKHREEKNEWPPRKEEVRICPKCKSSYFDEPKKEKTVTPKIMKTKFSKPLLIFARTKKEADAYAINFLGLNRSEYRYISEPAWLRGCPRDLLCVKLHRWYDNKSAEELDEIDLLLRAYNVLPAFLLQKSIDEEPYEDNY